MISSLLSALFIIAGGVGSAAFNSSGGQLPTPQKNVIPADVSGMPIRITAATIQDSSTDSRLDFSVVNASDEDISEIYLQVFVVGSHGDLVKAQESFNPVRLTAGATQSDYDYIHGIVGESGATFVTVSRVVTKLGVWQVDISAVEAAIQNRVNGKLQVTISASFDPHVIVTNSDRAQILELVLCDIVHDEEKVERLLGTPQLILLRSSVNVPLPKIAEKEVLALSQEEIQEIADRAERVVFLSYEPLTVRGSRILASISLRDALTRRRNVRTPYKYKFVFTCVKENGRWIIEKSTGYAQS